MKVAFLVDTFPSLSQTFIINQIIGLIEGGHEVQVLANVSDKGNVFHPDIEKYKLIALTSYWSNPAKSFIERISTFITCLIKYPNKLHLLLRSVNVFRFGKKAITFGLFYDLLPFIRTNKDFDIIHCQFGYLGNKGLFLKDIGASKAKIITSFRGNDITTYVHENGTSIYSDLFKRGDLFLPVCAYFKNLLINLGCSEKKIIIHHSGINVKKFSFYPKEFPFKTGNFRFITVGRLEEKKGIYYALHALREFKNNHPQIVFQYYIVGDGSLIDVLKKEVTLLGLKNQVIFCGSKKQSEVIELLKTAHIFIAPHITASNYDQEGIPNVLKEAMAIGIPVLSTYHSGIPELVIDNNTGFLVPEKDIKELVCKLSYIINNFENLDEIIRAARSHVENCFDSEDLNDQLIEIYHQINRVT